MYNVNTKNAHFTGNVFIDDPQYNIHSEDLEYNTETKVTIFHAQSTVRRDSGRGLLQTKNGTYDGKNGIAHFTGHSSIWNDGQYIEGDTLNYDKHTGYGLAIGNVITWDTAHHSWMYCGRVEYRQYKRTSLASINPVLVQANGKDTLYMRADTFYSAPMVLMPNGGYRAGYVPKPTDTLKYDSLKVKEKVVDGHSVRADTLIVDHEFDDVQVPRQSTKYKVPASKTDTIAVVKQGKKNKNKKKNTELADKMAITDTTQADSTAPLYFIGYHHVLIFSDSLQGKCDSVSYTRADSLIRMMYSPIVWAHNSQITGDTILLQLDSNQLRRMYVPNNAIIIAQSGPAKAQLFDQVQGKTLTAYFKDNTVTKMIVYPNAESIHYSKDEKGYYMSVDQATSTRMRIFFEDQKIRTIKFEQDWHGTMTPLEKADLSNMHLSRFKWLIEQRPKTKEELFQ